MPYNAPVDRKNIKILIVDDDNTNRLLLGSLLDKLGYSYLKAKDGREAVDVYESEQPDLILMDIMMPVLNGYEATEHIRRLETNSFTPIIFITVLSDDESLAKCIDAGGNDFLSKPYNTFIIESKIRSFLHLSRLYKSENENSLRIQAHNDWLENEYKIARSVINNVLKKEALDENVIKYKISPKAIFNGDVLMIAKTPEGNMRILIGDFTGHGLSGAIGSIPVAGIFGSMTEKGFAIDAIIKEINQRLQTILPVGLFLAAAIMDYDPFTRRLTIWSGGNPEITIYSRETSSVKHVVSSSNYAFSTVNNDKLTMNFQEFYLQPGDRVIAYTDGAIASYENNTVSSTKVNEVLAKHRDAETLFETVIDYLNRICEGPKLLDDLTIVELTAFEKKKEIVETEDEVQEQENRENKPSWCVNYEFDHVALKRFDPIPMIIQSMTDMCKIDEHKQSLYILLRELFSNALEHGILKLDSRLKHAASGFEHYYSEREKRVNEMTSGSIKVDINYIDRAGSGTLEIIVTDSGDGFSMSEMEKSDKASSYHGRGITLINQICNEVCYNDKGNQVRIKFNW